MTVTLLTTMCKDACVLLLFEGFAFRDHMHRDNTYVSIISHLSLAAGVRGR